MKVKIALSVFVLVLVIFVTIFSGCSFDRWVEVADGDYIPIAESSSHDDTATRLIERMIVNRENNAIAIILKDGSVISTYFTARPKQDWPSGCPANIGSTRMEVLDLDVDELAIGFTVIENPVLVRNCPRNPYRVALREDGEIGGGGTACAGNNRCIHFKPGTPS